MKLSTISEWLNYIGKVHHRDIELGLSRVYKVAALLELLTPSLPVITVGGTNGKGSTVAALAAIYQAAGFKVGSFTSPYLFQHNEEVKINGVPAQDSEFCAAFDAIENARQQLQTSLTAFEFHTLAALFIFRRHPLDVIILEVGLGGRLDAVNIIDSDIAIITTIALDHTDWLGSTRESIAREKAGIFRQHRPGVIGDFNPPKSIHQYAAACGTPLYCQGQSFFFTENPHASSWRWKYNNVEYDDLPLGQLATQNLSTALMAVHLLQQRLPVPVLAMQKALRQLQLPGRIEWTTRFSKNVIFDVAHNEAACAHLANAIANKKGIGRKLAVFSMLADKDITASIKAISAQMDAWYLGMLPDDVTRRASLTQLQQGLAEANVPEQQINLRPTIADAFAEALAKAEPNDVVVAFGSFYVVATLARQ